MGWREKEKGGENTAFNILTISYEKPMANIPLAFRCHPSYLAKTILWFVNAWFYPAITNA
ncbi:hypothetical protein GA0116948_102398 [Chitinophaga costaii]|uniref:Uncharacterized protein n=1 Tax=Chitinophaga costaii TaxID=1335309 RepID=A0A1C4B2S5_9BACT|nr:hypothetical protein DCM91_10670 [Chitinophaga costaii]SCC01181.1 hypothetical protein GA0116948_102398 [Chitinophaga costaii]